jgi:hypothetical protein
LQLVDSGYANYLDSVLFRWLAFRILCVPVSCLPILCEFFESHITINNSKYFFRWYAGEWTSKRRTPGGRNAGLWTPRWNDGLWTPHDGRWTSHDGLWTPHDGRWTARGNAVRRTAWYAAFWRAARAVSRRDAALGNNRRSPPSLDESGNIPSAADTDMDPFFGPYLRNMDNAYSTFVTLQGRLEANGRFYFSLKLEGTVSLPCRGLICTVDVSNSSPPTTEVRVRIPAGTCQSWDSSLGWRWPCSSLSIVVTPT